MRRSVLPALIFSRLWIAFFVMLGHLSHPWMERIDAGYAGVPNRWLNAWTTFDSQHFLSIAAAGYAPKTTPFFPLYPLLLRPFGPDGVRMALAGVLVSNLCFALALGLFWRLTREIYGETVARRAVWLLAFFPAGAYGMAVYTESLFLLLALGAFGCARGGKWVWAALLATGAALTRNSGPILALALGFEWLRRRKSGESGEKPEWSALVAVAAPALAFFGMQAYFRSHFGVSSVSAQAIYGRAPSFPWTPIWRDSVEILSGRGLEIVTILNLGATLLAIWLLWRARKIVPRSDAAFLGGVLLLQLCFARVFPPFTIASLRYLFSTWPFTQLLALQTGLFANRVRVLAFAAIYGLLCATYSYLFGLKSFLG